MDWVFLRGLGRQSGHWFQFRQLLEAETTFPFDGKLNFPDLPGAGLQKHKVSPTTIEQITNDIRDRIPGLGDQSNSEISHEAKDSGPAYRDVASYGNQKTGLKNRGYGRAKPSQGRCLFAISLGGMVALDWLHRYPEDFDCVFIVNSSLKGLSPVHHRLQPAAGLSIAARIPISLLRKDHGILESTVYDWTCNVREGKDRKVAHWVWLQENHGMTVSNLMRQLRAASRFRPPMALEKNPVFLVSKRDRLVRPECSDALFERYGKPGQYFMHPFAGHDLTSDDPEGTMDFLRRFLTSRPL